MSGECDLGKLLKGMEPKLGPEPYAIVALAPGASLPAEVRPFATVAEEEGLTLVVPVADLSFLAAGPFWAHISLAIHSDLSAVGLTAAFATALAGRGLSANVIAGFHHDHIFVPWERRDEALAVLLALGQGGSDV